MAQYRLSAFADEAGDTLSEQIAALKRNAIGYLELRTVGGVSVADMTRDALTDCAHRLQDAGIRVETVGSPIGKSAADAPFDAYRRVLDAAHILGASRIRMFSFFSEDEDAVCTRLEEMLALADAANVLLCHENEKEIFGDVTSRVLRLAERFYPRMRFIFDPANFVQCGCAPRGAYRALRPYVEYFHIKDARFADGVVVPPGEGDGDVAYLLREHARDHENVMLTVEPHLVEFAPVKDKVSFLHSARGYADRGEAFDAAVRALKALMDKEELTYA